MAERLDIRPPLGYPCHMSSAYAPQFGARFQFDRQSVDEQQAHYTVRIHLTPQHRDFDVKIGLPGGELTVTPIGDSSEAPQWAMQFVSALARQLYRGSRREEGWPRRIMRWHSAPTQSVAA
ncbi:MAG: hypothetical protein JNM40_22995 [Myxococcales bacterium]|nr:hypothetical protein [Myxococcales bacterium]